jgi:hypothetical protein
LQVGIEHHCFSAWQRATHAITRGAHVVLSPRVLLVTLTQLDGRSLSQCLGAMIGVVVTAGGSGADPSAPGLPSNELVVATIGTERPRSVVGGSLRDDWRASDRPCHIPYSHWRSIGTTAPLMTSSAVSTNRRARLFTTRMCAVTGEDSTGPPLRATAEVPVSMPAAPTANFQSFVFFGGIFHFFHFFLVVFADIEPFFRGDSEIHSWIRICVLTKVAEPIFRRMMRR